MTSPTEGMFGDAQGEHLISTRETILELRGREDDLATLAAARKLHQCYRGWTAARDRHLEQDSDSSDSDASSDAPMRCPWWGVIFRAAGKFTFHDSCQDRLVDTLAALFDLASEEERASLSQGLGNRIGFQLAYVTIFGDSITGHLKVEPEVACNLDSFRARLVGRGLADASATEFALMVLPCRFEGEMIWQANVGSWTDYDGATGWFVRVAAEYIFHAGHVLYEECREDSLVEGAFNPTRWKAWKDMLCVRSVDDRFGETTLRLAEAAATAMEEFERESREVGDGYRAYTDGLHNPTWRTDQV